jgi:hypothetical protein
MRFDRRVEEGPRPKRADWNKAREVPGTWSSAARRFGCRAENCLQRQAAGASRNSGQGEHMNVEQQGGGWTAINHLAHRVFDTQSHPPSLEPAALRTRDALAIAPSIQVLRVLPLYHPSSLAPTAHQPCSSFERQASTHTPSSTRPSSTADCV